MAKSNNGIKASRKWTPGDIVVHIILAILSDYLGTADRMDNHDKLQR